MHFDADAFAALPPGSPWVAYLIAFGYQGGPFELEQDDSLPEVLWPLRAITKSYAPFKIRDDSMSPESWEFGVGQSGERRWTIAGDSGHTWILVASWDVEKRHVELDQESAIDEPDAIRIGPLESELKRWVRMALGASEDEGSADFGDKVHAAMIKLMQTAAPLRSRSRDRTKQELQQLEAAIDAGAEDEATLAKWEQAQAAVDALAPAAWEYLLADRI